MSIIILHNPKCSKSRETLALLQQQGIQPQIELYLTQQYSVSELQRLASKLGIEDIRQMMRTKDERYQQLGLAAQDISQAQLLAALAQDSALLERPIVINGDKAKIGRPPEAVLSIL